MIESGINPLLASMDLSNFKKVDEVLQEFYEKWVEESPKEENEEGEENKEEVPESQVDKELVRLVVLNCSEAILAGTHKAINP